ncbi:unnamed protein product [marine sediment metagenome]|uniref:Uncharacterized protein n=1 Tax=marine sediment metagenome TaxID=412755 RepID=X1N5C5_9ZZZZ
MGGGDAITGLIRSRVYGREYGIITGNIKKLWKYQLNISWHYGEEANGEAQAKTG